MCDTVSDVSVQERVQVLRMDAASARNTGTHSPPQHCYLGWSSARVNYWRALVSRVTRDECCHAAMPCIKKSGEYVHMCCFSLSCPPPSKSGSINHCSDSWVILRPMFSAALLLSTLSTKGKMLILFPQMSFQALSELWCRSLAFSDRFFLFYVVVLY